MDEFVVTVLIAIQQACLFSIWGFGLYALLTPPPPRKTLVSFAREPLQTFARSRP